MGGGDGRLFVAGRLLTFSAFRMGVYARLALIRGWALIRIKLIQYLFSLQFFIILICYLVEIVEKY